ncbi:MAG: hypothetical protein QXF56_00090 [Candidatus Micrarchaeia archaeon]
MERKESCRFGKTVFCPKCKAESNFDFATDIVMDYFIIDAVCPSCGKEFSATLDSLPNLKSVKKKKRKEEVRESCRMGKSFICSSCGISLDFDFLTDATVKDLNVAGMCPNCYADIFITLDSFLNNRTVLVYGEGERPKEKEERKTPAGRKHRKIEKLDYIR